METSSLVRIAEVVSAIQVVARHCVRQTSAILPLQKV